MLRMHFHIDKVLQVLFQLDKKLYEELSIQETANTYAQEWTNQCL